MKRAGLLSWLLFVLMVVGPLGGAFFAASRTLSFRSISKQSQGVVVALVESRAHGGRAHFKPMVEWTDPAGKTHRFTGSVGSTTPSYSRGETVMVRYDPVKPESARLDSFMEDWFVALILGILGSFFTAVGLWRLSRPQEQDHESASIPER